MFFVSALTFLYITLLICCTLFLFQKTSNIIVSLISPDDVVDVKQINNIKLISDKLWMEEREQNIPDYDVIGLVVFRAYIWMFVKWLSATTFLLLEKAFFPRV